MIYGNPNTGNAADTYIKAETVEELVRDMDLGSAENLDFDPATLLDHKLMKTSTGYAIVDDAPDMEPYDTRGDRAE